MLEKDAAFLPLTSEGLMRGDGEMRNDAVVRGSEGHRREEAAEAKA